MKVIDIFIIYFGEVWLFLGTDQSKRKVKRIPKVIELGEKQDRLTNLEHQLRKANEYTEELEEVLRLKQKEVIETNSQLSDYITGK